VGTSAGGNRPKAIIAWNESTDEIRSGQVEAPPGFGYWVLKFDGVKDRSLGDPAGYGRIEYAYYLMAKDAGINMNESRLLEEEGRAHFMTRRFDRNSQGGKLHCQTLCAIAHFDFNSAGAYSYEQAFQVNRELRLPYEDMEQFFRRMVFNVIARNQDDHTKNISYLMDQNGIWHLSPAYDIIYAYNPSGSWTHNHQMTVNGKRNGFSRRDLIHVGKEMGIHHERLIIGEIVDAVSRWQKYSKEAGVERDQVLEIRNKFRTI
jgi:serine/threonine-protein kinase HipA